MESNGLLKEMTRLHCIHMYDVENGRYLKFNDGRYAYGEAAIADGSLMEGIEMLENAPWIGGHNIIGYDVPAIQKIHPTFFPRGKMFDTLIAARTIWPNLMALDAEAVQKGKRSQAFIDKKYVGSHKLEAWGFRMGVLKDQYEGGWEHFTQEMDDYCHQDVVVTKALYEKILGRGYSEQALELEFEVADAISMQERWGFAFDIEKAEALERTIRRRHTELADILRDTFKPWTAPVMSKGEQVVLIPKRDNKTLGYVKGVPVPKFKTVSFNPTSRDHIADRLIKLHGWRPVEFTENGKPKVDETTLAGLDYPEAKLLIEYLTLTKRLGQLPQAALGRWRIPSVKSWPTLSTLGQATSRSWM